MTGAQQNGMYVESEGSRVPRDMALVRRWSPSTVAKVRAALERGDSITSIAYELDISYVAARGLIYRHDLSGIARRGRRAQS